MAAYEQVTVFAVEKCDMKSTMTGANGTMRRLVNVSVRERVGVVTGRKPPGRTILIRRRHAAVAAEHWGVADTARTTRRGKLNSGMNLTRWHPHDMRKVTP